MTAYRHLYYIIKHTEIIYSIHDKQTIDCKNSHIRVLCRKP